MMNDEQIYARLELLRNAIGQLPYVATNKYILFYNGTEHIQPTLVKMLVVCLPFDSFTQETVSPNRPVDLGVMVSLYHYEAAGAPLHKVTTGNTQGKYYVKEYDDILAVEADFRYFVGRRFNSTINYLELYGVDLYNYTGN